jgi:hypothetical protein
MNGSARSPYRAKFVDSPRGLSNEKPYSDMHRISARAVRASMASKLKLPFGFNTLSEALPSAQKENASYVNS